MASSDSVTIPVVFARLTPNNTEAKRAFTDVAAAVTTVTDLDLAHHKRFMVIQDYQHDRSPTPEIGSFSATATEADELEVDMYI